MAPPDKETSNKRERGFSKEEDNLRAKIRGVEDNTTAHEVTRCETAQTLRPPLCRVSPPLTNRIASPQTFGGPNMRVAQVNATSGLQPSGMRCCTVLSGTRRRFSNMRSNKGRIGRPCSPPRARTRSHRIRWAPSRMPRCMTTHVAQHNTARPWPTRSEPRSVHGTHHWHTRSCPQPFDFDVFVELSDEELFAWSNDVCNAFSRHKTPSGTSYRYAPRDSTLVDHDEVRREPAVRQSPNSRDNEVGAAACAHLP